jgi:hypothetical protein
VGYLPEVDDALSAESLTTLKRNFGLSRPCSESLDARVLIGTVTQRSQRYAEIAEKTSNPDSDYFSCKADWRRGSIARK